MMLDRQFAVGLLDLLLVRVAIDAEDLIVVALGHGNEKIKSKNYKYRKRGGCSHRSFMILRFSL